MISTFGTGGSTVGKHREGNFALQHSFDDFLSDLFLFVQRFSTIYAADFSDLFHPIAEKKNAKRIFFLVLPGEI